MGRKGMSDNCLGPRGKVHNRNMTMILKNVILSRLDTCLGPITTENGALSVQ
jgi:hypothetical protein